MKQLTLTALYGPKEKQDLIDLIKKIWYQIESSKLNRVFQKYHINQIHSTITGMEKIIGGKNLFNANIWQDECKKVQMNFSNIYSNINEYFPQNIQFGGFESDFEEFTSLRKKPYERSFQINWHSKRVILMGWSMKNLSNLADNKLLNLREALYRKNKIRHKYRDDNDFYLVLGQVENIELLAEDELADIKEDAHNLESQIRDDLARSPKRIKVTIDDLSIVRYESTTLELNTSEAWGLGKFKNNSELIDNLY